MIKLLFLKHNELAATLSEILNVDTSHSSIEYSEDKGTDVLRIGSKNEEIAIDELLVLFGNHVNESIVKYDVFEVGDEGEGFAFFLA